jgi:hypothetical protein
VFGNDAVKDGGGDEPDDVREGDGKVSNAEP